MRWAATLRKIPASERMLGRPRRNTSDAAYTSAAGPSDARRQPSDRDRDAAGVRDGWDATEIDRPY